MHRFEEITSTLSRAHPLQGSVGALVDAGFLQSIDIVASSGVFLDVHADILKLGLSTRQAEVVWSRTEEVWTPSGTRIRAMDAEVSLIIHLIHLNKDRFREFPAARRFVFRASDWRGTRRSATPYPDASMGYESSKGITTRAPNPQL